MRSLLVVIHRWFGLATALFLFIAGLIGTVISWDHELDEEGFLIRLWLCIL